MRLFIQSLRHKLKATQDQLVKPSKASLKIRILVKMQFKYVTISSFNI